MLSPHPFPHTTPWTKKSVLSIDGGGIRGYSSLVILQALMEKVGEIERAGNPNATSSICSSALGPMDDEICATPSQNPLLMSEYWPCHYFDYIAGVGTGGIIAMLLGRYRMSVRETMERYRDICVITVERRLTSPQPKFVRRESVLSMNHIMSRRSNVRTVKLIPAWPGPHENEGNLESDPERCRTIVCGCDLQLQPFRSYPSPERRRHAISDIIIRCVHANPPPGTYPDAKYCYNNPSRTVLAEVSSLCDSELSGDRAVDLLSIGGAVDKPVHPRADELQYQMSNQIQRVHREMTEGQLYKLDKYCRLDLSDHNLCDVGVNEWKPEFSDSSTFRRIEKATKIYLENTAKDLDDLAAALVRKRRLRAETVQWERWALGISYRCPQLNCADWNKRFEDRVGFWAHMLTAHGIPCPNKASKTEAPGPNPPKATAESLGYGIAYGEVTREEYEAMGRTREPVVDTEIESFDRLNDLQTRITAAKEKRGRDLRRLAENVVAKRKGEQVLRRLAEKAARRVLEDSERKGVSDGCRAC